MTKPAYLNNAADIAIIGGGMAGCVQAIYLAEEFPWLNIIMLEKNKEILNGTSSMNPGRPTFGFHYRDLRTATLCQDNTVKFTKFLRRIGCQHIFAKAPQRGIYVLMKRPVEILGTTVKPVFGSDEIQPVFEQIKYHAIEQYADDLEFNELFGPPDEICRELERSEYERFLTAGVIEGVGACYETAERTFDTAGICCFLRDYLKRINNVAILTEANVTRLQKAQDSKGGGYHIGWDHAHKAKHESRVARLLTLACWETVGLFRKQLGKPGCKPTHNRLKMLGIMEFDLGADLQDTVRPIFIASGPFCMVSPQGCIQMPGGRIRYRCACTLALKTNVMTVPDNRPMPVAYERMLRGTISHEEKMKMAAPILQGAQQLFTCLRDARLVDARFGTVRVPYGKGNYVDLHDPASEHHARNYPGCYQLGDGLFVNEAMKMIYSVYNAEMMVEWVRASCL